MTAVEKYHNISALERAALKRLPLPARDMLFGGAEDENTLGWNEQAFSNFVLRPNVLVDVAQRDTSCTIMGQASSLPLMLAPAGGAGLWHPQADLAVAQGAADEGVIHSLSTGGAKTIEEVAGVSDGPKMFQLYAFKDHALNQQLIDRARAADFSALCVTVDTASGAGNRERDVVNGFNPGAGLSWRSKLSIACNPRWAFNMAFGNGTSLGMVESMMEPGKHTLQDVRAFLGRTMTPSLTWKDAARIASDWGGPFAIKGIMTGEDARRAVDNGASAVIISNHGGRQLDGVHATISVLPEVVEAVGGEAEIIIDGGIRRGTDLLKIRALGGTAGMIGRPYLYGLALAGREGVRRAINIFRSELLLNMGLLGVCNIDEITRDFVEPR